MYLTISLIVWSFIIFYASSIAASVDYYGFIKKDKPISKKWKRSRSFVFGAFNVACGLIILFAGKEPYSAIYELSFIQCALLSVSMHTLYWLCFDLMLNEIRNKPYDYISNDGQDFSDVRSDSAFHKFGKNGGKIQIAAKLLIILYCITVIVFYNRIENYVNFVISWWS